MSDREFKKIRKLIKGIKGLEVKLPKEADEKYFSTLESKIMNRIGVTCEEVRESLVDLCEGALDKERTTEMTTHIDSCKGCTEEYQLTMNLISGSKKVDTREESVDDYFATLADKITEKAFEGTATDLCETAQNYIVNKYLDEAIPANIQKHLNTCHSCQMEVKTTEKIVTNLKRLSVPLPNEQYFEAQLRKIDAAINMLPSPRIAKSETREKISNYIIDVLDTLRTTLMQPQAAIAVSAMVALLIIGGRVYYSHDSVEERQINLSEVLNKTNAIATGESPPKGIDDDGKSLEIDTATALRQKDLEGRSISNPKEDEKIELRQTGTAENKSKSKSKKLN